MLRKVQTHLAASVDRFVALGTNVAIHNSIVKAAQVISRAYEGGNKLLIAGNGGSATDADHFAAELVGRYKKGDKALPAIPFTNPATMTAVGNDYSFEDIFARQVQAYATGGDVFFAISTSGNSRNILRALEVANDLRVHTVGLFGETGGNALALCDLALCVPATYTAHIQEMHIAVIHSICECIDR